MPLELIHSGQKDWKGLERWSSVYDSPHSATLCDIFGKGNMYCKSLLRTELVTDNAKEILVLGTAVCDLPYAIAENFKNVQNVDWVLDSDKFISKKPHKKITEHTSIPSKHYDVVIDNGKLDRECYKSPTDSFVKTRMNEMMDLAASQFLIITVGHDCLIRDFMKFFKDNSADIRVVRCAPNSQSAQFVPIPIVISIGKDGTSDSKMTIREPVQVEGKWTFRQAKVNLLRLPRMIKDWRMEHYIKQIVPAHTPGALRLFDIVDPEGEVAYSLSMYDRVLSKTSAKTVRQLKPCVAVMVPLGDEHHWLYRTPSGHQRLTEKAGTKRVLCVFLPSFKPLSTTQESPSEIVERIRKDIGAHLLQLNNNPKKPVLLMTQQEKFEDERQVVAKFSSELQGEILVYDIVVDKHDEEFAEDPEADNEFYPLEASEFTRRTLILASNPRVAQTELWYNTASKEFNFTHICHSYQLPILRAIQDMLDHTANNLSGALLGIGGGHLHSLFKKAFGTSVTMECVDLDPVIVEVAGKYFDYSNEKTIIMDAVKYVEEKMDAEQKLDFLIVDINGSLGETLPTLEDVTGPHKAFLTSSFLHNAASCVSETGCVIFNTVCQTNRARKQLGTYLKQFYPRVSSVSFSDELNIVFYCYSDNTAYLANSACDLRSSLLKAADKHPTLAEVVNNTPLYLGAMSKHRVNVYNHSS